jgi:hypothetical protein
VLQNSHNFGYESTNLASHSAIRRSMRHGEGIFKDRTPSAVCTDQKTEDRSVKRRQITFRSIRAVSASLFLHVT